MITLFIILSLFGNTGYYTGIGTAHYTDTTRIDEAIEEAKEMAREDLAKNIRVQIVSITKRTIGENAEKVTDKFDKFIEEKTNVYLEGIEYTEPYIDPKEKTVTITAQISKEKYDKKVKQDLENKKSRIIQYYKEYKNNLKKGDYTLALKSLYRARGWIRLFFNDLPIMGDLNNDKKDEELNAAVVGKIDELIHELSFEPTNKKLLFSSSGDISGGPVGFHIYWEENGVSKAVANFPVYASFSKGSGKIEKPNVYTDRKGYAELEVRDIDPSYPSVEIKIQPDIEKFFPPFNEQEKDEAIAQLKKELGLLPEWYITIERKKYLALSIYATSGGIPSSIKDEVKGIIMEKGYNVVNKNIKGYPNMEKLRNDGIEYICVIKISVSSKYISDYEMYAATASGVIKLYSTTEETELKSIPIGSSKKVEIDRNSAIQSAISALRGPIIRKVKSLNW